MEGLVIIIVVIVNAVFGGSAVQWATPVPTATQAYVAPRPTSGPNLTVAQIQATQRAAWNTATPGPTPIGVATAAAPAVTPVPPQAANVVNTDRIVEIPFDLNTSIGELHGLTGLWVYYPDNVPSTLDGRGTISSLRSGEQIRITTLVARIGVDGKPSMRLIRAWTSFGQLLMPLMVDGQSVILKLTMEDYDTLFVGK